MYAFLERLYWLNMTMRVPSYVLLFEMRVLLMEKFKYR